MKYYYDTEFLEDGKTIELISIGIVAEDGREYYAVNSDMPTERIKDHAWLRQNVWPHLPLRGSRGDGVLDRRSALVKPRWVIANEVREFLLAGDAPDLWAWYSAYDHVALAQLFGTMINLPKGIPMFTNDVKALSAWTGIDQLPVQAGTAHNALDDARHVKAMHDHIAKETREP